MRSGAIGLLAVAGLALSLFVGWNWPASLSADAGDAQRWQVRELLFLKAAYDRMQDDLARDLEGSASLRDEQKRVMQRMAETATLVPPDAVPAEIGRLLASAAAPPQTETAPPQTEPAALTQLIEAVIAEKAPDLRVGLGPSGAPGIDFSAFAIDPEIRQPIKPPPARRKRAAAAAKKQR